MPEGRRTRRPHQAPDPHAAHARDLDPAADAGGAMRTAIEAAGYHPQAVTEGVEAAVAGERVLDFVVHHEPTFDHDEVRRHLTVVAITPTRLVVGHTDEHPPDQLLPSPYTSTSTEAVPLGAVRSVVVQRMVAQQPAGAPGGTGGSPTEAVLTVAWGAVRHVDLEPAQCADPDCEADHGYTGTLASDDFSLRVSATADGADAVGRLLDFARGLSESTTRT